MSTQTSVDPIAHGNHDDAEYDAFLTRLNARFSASVEQGTRPVFTTDATDLWAAYLDSFPIEQRQHHNCNACRRFIQQFGGLVTIGEDGGAKSAIWDERDAPELYRPAVRDMERLVRRANVTGVFLSSATVWGQPETGIWHHLSVTPPAAMLYRGRGATAGQKMAEKREDYRTLQRALGEFSHIAIEQAVTLLSADALYRSEKHLGVAKWLEALHKARSAVRGRLAENVVWLAVATAPAGFCHPRSSMIGTLLEDIAAGMLFDDVKRRFDAKMHPLRYQRPQAAPAAGAIAAAEKLVAELGIERSLQRRFARLDEIEAVWRPAPAAPDAPRGGVFANVAPKGAVPARTELQAPPVTMTWEKFARTVLPTAEQIEFYVRIGRMPFTTLVTAVNADAPPILQWDREDARNPVSWYFWHGGSTPMQFGLQAEAFHQVEAIALKPSMWGAGGFDHQGKGVLFVLEGACDQNQPGSCLFPEILRADLHGARSVIEAYSRNERMQETDGPLAAGVMLKAPETWNVLVRVTVAGRTQTYKLDRWD